MKVAKSKRFLEPIGNRSVVDKVIDRITSAIVEGELVPGSRLPTETELGEAFGVGRNSIREAIKTLVSLGILEIKRSEGTFVRKEFSEQMINPLLYGLILEKDSSKSIIELRRIFEVGTIQAAISKVDEKQLKIIKETLDALIALLNAPNPNYQEVLEADIAFHKAIEQSLNNHLILRISDFITKLTYSSIGRTIRKHIESGNAQFLVETHTKIFNLLLNRDVDTVEEVMDESYMYWKDSL